MHRLPFYLFVQALLLLFLFSCSKERIEGPLIKYQGTKEGHLISHYPNGSIMEEATFKNGKMNGERILYDSAGHIVSKEFIVNDLFEGPYTSYYSNGQIKSQGQYKNNEMSGTWSFYYPSGQLKEEVEFENNKENGPFVEYHKNGKISAKGNYLDGDQEHGLLQLYDSTGTLERKMNCTHGICKTIWTPDSLQQK